MGVITSRGNRFQILSDGENNQLSTKLNVMPQGSTDKRQSSIVKNITMFNDIDEHVKQTPNSAKSSVNKLVEYLIRPTKTDLEKVRAIYKFIQLNISYDVESYRNGCSTSTDSEDVLRCGKALCTGYCSLFADMCIMAHVPVKCIHGFAKGLTFNPERGFELSDNNNHEWNAVLLAGEWRLVDCTWGSGYVNSQLKYERFNNEYYFLTDPKKFIRSHFPYMDWNMETSQKWQLLKHPVDLETFNKRVKCSVLASDNDIQFLSHENVKCNVKIREKTEIQLGFSSSNISLYGYLSDCDGSEVTDCLVISKNGYKHSIYVTAPSTGQFNLEIYGNHTKTTIFNLYVKYIIYSH